MEIRIKASEIKSEEICDAMSEIASDEDLRNKISIIANYYNWAIGDTIEAVASHIVTTDTDYIMDENWNK